MLVPAAWLRASCGLRDAERGGRRSEDDDPHAPEPALPRGDGLRWRSFPGASRSLMTAP